MQDEGLTKSLRFVPTSDPVPYWRFRSRVWVPRDIVPFFVNTFVLVKNDQVPLPRPRGRPMEDRSVEPLVGKAYDDGV